MLSEPKTEYRAEQPYVAIRKNVPMQKIPEVLPPLIPEVRKWMLKNHITPDGPELFLYKSIHENNVLVTEVGVLVKNPEPGEGSIKGGSFPAGYYATIIYTGDYRNMMEAHMALEAWINKMGLTEKRRISGNDTEWGARTEFYLTDPDNEPHPEKWITEIAFLLDDAATEPQ